MIPTSSTAINVSELPTGTATLNAAISAVATASSVAVTYTDVSNSFAPLENITTSIAQHQADLKARGLILQSWGPNPSHDIVLVTLQPGSVSTSDAQSILDGIYGSGVTTVSSVTAPPFTAAGRENDVAPFTGGDAIHVVGSQNLYCTSSWSMQGRASGAPFILVAGHCGNGIVTISGSGNSVGSVSTQYFSNNGYDFESIRTSSDRDDVWEGGPGYSSVSAHAVSAYSVPPADSYMTFDGAVTGQVPDALVTLVDGCTSISYSSEYPHTTWTICHIGETNKNTTVVQPGDSGGPAYVRQPNNTVSAAGVIIAYGNGGKQGIFTEIRDATLHSNLALKSTSGLLYP